MSLPETYKALTAQGKGKDPKVEELPIPKPDDDQVLVRIDFAPLHPADILKLQGLSGAPASSNQPDLVGFEGSGTVAAIGNNLKVPHKVGNKVYTFGNGSFGQYMLASSEKVALIEEDLSLEEASAHFVNPATVYYIGVVAERENHKAVIHTVGSSALGRMLIRYFKHKGIKLISVVRQQRYIEELKREGADIVLNSQDPNFEEKLKEVAEKEEATMALEAIGGDFTNKVFKALPPKSKLYMYGNLSGEDIKSLSIMELFKDKSLAVFTVFHYFQEVQAKGEWTKFYKEVHQLLPTVFKSNVQKVFKLEDIKEALSYYQENSSKGKILFQPN